MKISLEKLVAILLPAGGISYLFNYYLEQSILRDSLWSVTAILLPSIIAAIILIFRMKLLSDESYRMISGIKLKLYKSAMILIVFLGSVVMFGSWINILTIQTNMMSDRGDLEYMDFKIIEVKKSKPTLSRRSNRRVPEVSFKNDEISDNYKITNLDWNEFELASDSITIYYSTGFWNIKIIKELKYKSAK